MRTSLVRTRRAIVFAMATVVAVGVAGPAYANDPPPPPPVTYNNAVIDIHGGNAGVFGGCLEFAKQTARRGGVPRSNACKTFASANGGNVALTGVSVFVDQEGSGHQTHNNVAINISGGDATAVAGCVNFLQGTASGDQVNQCKTAVSAVGGSVDLTAVDITIIQLG